jgi:hypothetical protein
MTMRENEAMDNGKFTAGRIICIQERASGKVTTAIC